MTKILNDTHVTAAVKALNKAMARAARRLDQTLKTVVVIAHTETSAEFAFEGCCCPTCMALLAVATQDAMMQCAAAAGTDAGHADAKDQNATRH